MSQLLGSLGLIAGTAAELSPAEIAMMTAASLKGARRLNDSIEDILQYVNSPSLVPPGDRFPVKQIPELIAEVCREMELQPPGIAFEDKLTNELLILPGRTFELILREILENAKKFHPANNPQVEVAVALSSTDRLNLRIADDGLTLTPDQLAQVWKPYYQGEKYFTGEVAGMGLGLSTVAAMVWPVQGTCRLYNRDKGPGVIVELGLPINGGRQGS
jgi:K+-sensing histidine kinase KdpD